MIQKFSENSILMHYKNLFKRNVIVTFYFYFYFFSLPFHPFSSSIPFPPLLVLFFPLLFLIFPTPSSFPPFLPFSSFLSFHPFFYPFHHFLPLFSSSTPILCLNFCPLSFSYFYLFFISIFLFLRNCSILSN